MLAAVDAFRAEHSTELVAVHGIGLSGQMHGAIVMDEAGDGAPAPRVGQHRRPCRLLLGRCNTKSRPGRNRT